MRIATTKCRIPLFVNNCKRLNAIIQAHARKHSRSNSSDETVTKATPTTSLKLAKLKERSILRVEGRDSMKFLQGLTTNDVTCLTEEHCKILYTMLLNPQGRVLYDVFLHTVPGEEFQCLMDYEEGALDRIVSHLKRYKLRSKVKVSDASKEIEPWVVFSDHNPDAPVDVFQGGIVDDNKIIASRDPRIPELGVRVLAPWNESPSELLKLQNCMVVDSEVYRLHRYRLGVAEGLEEIPSENALPLEYNLALLNGVSFMKGCYIGQELTARTHHTGVIRKRIMPLSLLVNDITKYPDIEPNSPIKGESGKSAGRVCVMRGQYGLGLLRLNEALNSKVMTVKASDGTDIEITSERPFWWPQDLKY